MPRFNREKLVIALLRKNKGVLIQRSWDTPGVIAAGNRVGEALEHPAAMRWDPHPPNPEIWAFDRQLMIWRREAIRRHRR
jgi:hypothetical protein